jgi:hypothetical protein
MIMWLIPLRFAITYSLLTASITKVNAGGLTDHQVVTMGLYFLFGAGLVLKLISSYGLLGFVRYSSRLNFVNSFSKY